MNIYVYICIYIYIYTTFIYKLLLIYMCIMTYTVFLYVICVIKGGDDEENVVCKLMEENGLIVKLKNKTNCDRTAPNVI